MVLVNTILRQCGEIGKHNRLKICRPFGLVGSSPTTGTILMTKKQILGAWVLIILIVILNCFLAAEFLV